MKEKLKISEIDLHLFQNNKCESVSFVYTYLERKGKMMEKQKTTYFKQKNTDMENMGNIVKLFDLFYL